MRLIRAKDYRHMPWKNGGGETIEIAVFPRSADMHGFDWRVSMARVDGDGPFSSFPGVDRTLAVLDGRGIELEVEGEGACSVGRTPHSFPGDAPTSARLIDGPVTDLNVMTRRGKYMHRVTPVELSAAREIVVMSPVALVYCHEGQVTIEQEFVSPISLAAGDTLFIEAMPNGLELRPQRPSLLYLIEVSPIREG
ncbi:MAG: HutD family protein [Rhizobiaceae bacterium]|nr:HutD family protein [Rhizobiaceae bacterium]